MNDPNDPTEVHDECLFMDYNMAHPLSDDKLQEQVGNLTLNELKKLSDENPQIKQVLNSILMQDTSTVNMIRGDRTDNEASTSKQLPMNQPSVFDRLYRNVKCECEVSK